MFAPRVMPAPFVIVIGLGYICWAVGPAALAGIGILLLGGPVTKRASTMMSFYSKEKALASDERVGFLDQIISGIRVVKGGAWEVGG